MREVHLRNITKFGYYLTENTLRLNSMTSQLMLLRDMMFVQKIIRKSQILWWWNKYFFILKQVVYRVATVL
jgi:hypothetical protein